MDIQAQIELAKENLLEEVNRVLDDLVFKLQNQDKEERPIEKREVIYPLTVNPSNFKKKTPICLLINGERIIAPTWKRVFQILMLRCIEDNKKYNALMQLRNEILGRQRVLLSDTDNNMLRPFKISDGLYAETQYDTESLMRILLHRILDAVNFDYSEMSVVVRK
jgi:hypothetical protein